MRRNDAKKLREQFKKQRNNSLEEIIVKETKEILDEDVVELEPFEGNPDSRSNLIKKIKRENVTEFVPTAPWPTTEIVETKNEAIPYAVYLARKQPEDPEIIELPVLEEEETGPDMAAIANVRRILKEEQEVSDSVD